MTPDVGAPGVKTSRGPLGALPTLSRSARRALAGCALLAAGSAVALVMQAAVLSSLLADVVLRAQGPGQLGGRLLLLAVAVLARAVLAWATETVAARAAAGAKEELRAGMLDRALELGPEWINADDRPGRGPAGLTALATKGLDSLDAYFTQYLPALVTAAVVPPLVGVWILLSDWTSALLIAVTVPLIPVFAVLIGWYTQRRTAKAADATARLSGHLLELVRALPVLTAFRRAGAQAEAVRRVGEANRQATMATLRVAFLSALVLELISTLSVALVAVDIGLRLVSGGIGLATGLLVLVLAPECYLPLRAAGAAHHASEDGLEAVRRVAEVLAEPGARTRGAGPAPSLADHPLRVEQLRVRRRGGFAPDGLSFTVAPGEIVSLSTASASGKSTALSVLLGFTAPSSGRVTVDDVDVTAVDAGQWRRQLAWVPQRPAFTGGTVAQELALAVSDLVCERPPAPAELREVAGQAAAEHLLDRRVDQLSTGERQRVAMARALLRVRRGARLLLLDEPTAHLDPTTAARVMAAVKDAADAGVAVVIATHRGVAPDRPEQRAMTDQDTDRPVLATPARIHRLPLLRLFGRRGVAGALLGAAAVSCGVALTATAAWLIAKASGQPPILTLSVAVVAVRAFGLGKAALRYLERLVSHEAAFRLSGALRIRLWNALVRLGPARTAGLRRTDGVARLVDDTDAVRDLVPRVLLPPMVSVVVVLGAVAVQAAILPAAGLALATALLVAAVGGPAVALAVQRRASSAMAAGRRRVAATVLALLDAAADLIASGAHVRVRADLAEADARLASQARRQALGFGAATALITAATGMATLACTALAASAVAAGRLDPVLAPLLALVPLATVEALTALPPAAAHRDALRAAAGRVGELLSAHGPTDRGGSDRDALTRGATTGGCEADRHGHVPAVPGGHRGRVQLHGVDVRWPDAADLALRGVDLTIPEGAWVAVVGPSGAGKSTLLALLLGFLHPERGDAELPHHVTWCPQEPQLVSTTVRENLRLAKPDADDGALRDTLRLAGLPGWTDRLDNLVGTGGTSLSGGEAQRLALARAVLAAGTVGVVLLDEPTAHVDEPTARELLARLRAALAGHTVVHVTHRPEEAQDADLVVEVIAGTVRVRERTVA